MYRVAIISLTFAAGAAAPSGGPARPASEDISPPTHRVVPAAAADTGFVDVTGVGVVMVEPDRARLSFAVESEGATAQEAVRKNADLMTATLEALTRAVTDLDIHTNGYNVQPRYTGRNRANEEIQIAGYTAVNHIELTANRIAEVGMLIDLATGAGANRVASLVFTSSNIDEARREALRRAVADARGQAETMAQALGIPLGPPMEVRANNQQRQTRQRDVYSAMAQEVATPISAGDQAVRATVTIRYRLGGE